MSTLVTIDGAATKDNTGTGTSNNWTWANSHTTGSASNRILVVGLSQFSDGSNVAVSWNGQSLTNLITCGGTGAKASLWYLLNPAASTSAAPVVTCTNARRMAGWCQSFANVNQSTPFMTPLETSGSATSSTLTVTDAAVGADLVLNVLSKRDSTETPAEDGAGEWTDRSTNATASFNVWVGGQEFDGAASVPFNWTWGATSRVHGIVACAMVAIAAGITEVQLERRIRGAARGSR